MPFHNTVRHKDINVFTIRGVAVARKEWEVENTKLSFLFGEHFCAEKVVQSISISNKYVMRADFCH